MKQQWWNLIRALACGLALAVVAPTYASTSEDAADAHRKVIVDATQRFVDALRAQRAAIKEDPQIAYRLSEETVLPHLDFPRIAQWVLGRNWRTATPEQRARFTQEFRDFLVNTYVKSMVTYADEIISNANKVSYPPSSYRPGDTNATVRSIISLDSGRTVAVDYQMFLDDGVWKVYDLTIEGVSLALTYRNTFTSQIQQVGLDGLIAELATRNNPPAAVPTSAQPPTP